MPGLDHLHDLDLSFTPATNLQQLQRVTIANDEAIQLPVAWLDVDAGTLTELPQIYVRRDEATFWYQAPTLYLVRATPIVRNAPDGERELTTARWGMPSPVFALKGRNSDPERKMQRFKSLGSPRKFLSTHAAVYNTFQRHLASARTHRTFRAAAMNTWREAVVAT
jgi:hypothetical protein